MSTHNVPENREKKKKGSYIYAIDQAHTAEKEFFYEEKRRKIACLHACLLRYDRPTVTVPLA